MRQRPGRALGAVTGCVPSASGLCVGLPMPAATPPARRGASGRSPPCWPRPASPTPRLPAAPGAPTAHPRSGPGASGRQRSETPPAPPAAGWARTTRLLRWAARGHAAAPVRGARPHPLPPCQRNALHPRGVIRLPAPLASRPPRLCPPAALPPHPGWLRAPRPAPPQAARAYDAAVVAIRGHHSRTNFSYPGLQLDSLVPQGSRGRVSGVSAACARQGGPAGHCGRAGPGACCRGLAG